MIFKHFDWDDKNISHISRHKVHPEEVEEVCYGKPYIRRAREGKYHIYGVTNSGRCLFIVVKYKGKNRVRVITARNMTNKEKSLYKRKSNYG